jgi:hypothetical protein
MPRWLSWGGPAESAESKAEALKKVRQRTDQKIKQQAALKEQEDEKEPGNEKKTKAS